MKTPIRKPRKLDLSTSFYVLLPEELTTAELTEYEIYYRQHFRQFHSRMANMLFFSLPTVQMRDAFLLSFENGMKQEGYAFMRSLVEDHTKPGNYLDSPVPGWPPARLPSLANLEHLAHAQFLGFQNSYLNAPENEDFSSSLVQLATPKADLTRATDSLRKRAVRTTAPRTKKG